MPRLFEPMKIRDLEVRNRIFVAPMCQYSCENTDGVPGDWHLVHYAALAQGVPGLIVAEATGVSPEGRISPWCTGIWNNEQVTAWAKVVEQVHRYGTKFGVQLAHAGRKASTYRPWSGQHTIAVEDGGWPTVSSTDQPFPHYDAPTKLDAEGIDEVVEQFGLAAKRSGQAGFDFVQIHAAHGYLIHQFLSPLANDRTDEYGGSLENRARFLIRVVESVRAGIGDLPLMIRFSATDWLEGGFTPEDCAQVAVWCEERGVDFIDVSSGGITMPAPIPFGPGYQVPLARTIAQAVSIPVGAVGSITSGEQAEEILEDEVLDFVSIGRAALGAPYWPIREAKALGINLDYAPKQLERAVF